jgi:4-hydroxy-2-oxovalerate aldolase
VKSLEGVGLMLIEVGHGVGLGASEKGLGVAAETDEAYMKATAGVIREAEWGMFCIPGIATLEHIDLAASYGMDFVRIGTNVEDYAKSKPFIERAKKHGMFVCSNFMKSYVCKPEEFAHYAAEAEKFGSDVIYIVDSAGGMFPDDLARYVGAIRERSSTMRLGFHGHNNLGMGVANALKAAQLGIEIIDTSLQGFGRSAGNTPTEQFLCGLIRYGIDMDIDPVAVMNIAEKYIQPMIPTKGISSVDMVAGLALFHSSYMPVIEKYATQYRVDPRKLIISVCVHDKASAPAALVEEMAKKLSDQGIHGNWKPLYSHYYGGEQG